MAARVIFHIDINAFYASAHLIQDDSLVGKPVVVSRDVMGAVVTTASYEARAFGITSAMPLSEAKRRCQDLVIVEVDFDLYLELSNAFIDIIKGYSPLVQQASIDECYVDVTDVIKNYRKPLDLAVEIQQKIYNELKLPVSIGVAPNKFLAKMASDMNKPLGITVLRIREVEEKLWPLPIEEMHGIGKKTVPKLKAMGIHQIGDLNGANYDQLKLVLGNRTQTFIDYSNGQGSNVLDIESQAKSIGQSKTFSTPIYDYTELKEAITHEIDEIVRRAKEQDMVGKTIQFALRTEEFKTAARSVTIDRYINQRDDILERVMFLYSEFEDESGITFISVTLANLKPRDEVVEQIDLFDMNELTTVDEIIQELNNNLSPDVFKKASSIVKEGENV